MTSSGMGGPTDILVVIQQSNMSSSYLQVTKEKLKDRKLLHK